jgi:hypothetical protein
VYLSDVLIGYGAVRGGMELHKLLITPKTELILNQYFLNENAYALLSIYAFNY